MVAEGKEIGKIIEIEVIDFFFFSVWFFFYNQHGFLYYLYHKKTQ